MKRLLVVLALGILAPKTAAAQNIAGNWQGTITFGPNPPQRVGLVVTQAADSYTARLVIIDQDGMQIPVQRVILTGNMLRLEIPSIRGSYEGLLNPAATEIAGALIQGMPVTLNFKRVEALDAPPTFGEQERAAVVAAISGYFQAFTDNDFDRFRTFLRAPFTRWSVNGASTLVATLDEVVAGYKTTRQTLEGTDYALSRAAAMIITPLSATSAMVDIHWRRDRKDGSLFQEGAEILTVSKTPEGWKINGNISRALSQYRKTF